MAVTWQISHRDRLVALRQDLRCRHWQLDAHGHDMLVLGACIRASPALAKFGPLAIVATSDKQNQQAQMFATLADVERPLQIFRTEESARKWLAEISRA